MLQLFVQAEDFILQLLVLLLKQIEGGDAFFVLLELQLQIDIFFNESVVNVLFFFTLFSHLASQVVGLFLKLL